jgi:ferredoxin-NADP reductase
MPTESISFGSRLNKDTVLQALRHLQSIAAGGAPPIPVPGRGPPPHDQSESTAEPSEVFDLMVMLCGPEPFMDSMTDTLAALGVPRNNILTEAFDF